MSTPLKITILACSAHSTGELTLALDWAKRCTRPLELSVVAGATLASQVKWAGRVLTYPARSGFTARGRIRQLLQELRPDVLLLADLLLFRGAHYELGLALDTVVAECMAGRRVVGLDLYDWDRHVGVLDCHGRPIFAQGPGFPATVTRLLPSPYLRPAPCSKGRGTYAMMADSTPLSEQEKRQARATLGLGDGKVVLLTTSTWQHVAQTELMASSVATHFPALLLRLLDLAAASLGGVTLAHLGPAPMALPPDVQHLRYHYVPQLPPGQFRSLLGCTDLMLTGNCIATSVIRGASMRVPTAALYLGQPVRGTAPADGTPAARALAAYLNAVSPSYAFRVWPLGMATLMDAVLHDNPFADLQCHLDVMQPDAAVAGLQRMLTDAAAVDAQRHAQAAYFQFLQHTVGSADDALEAVL